MRWLTAVGVLLYLARSSDAAVLKCSPESRDPLCASEKRDISPPPSPPDAECLAGSEWESNCHSCRCSNSGIAECVKQDSCELQVFKEPIKCKPSTSFQKDCNTCTCLENGLGLCTLKGCGFPIYTDRRKRQAPNGQNKCKPGSSWKESCNSCWCTDAGVSVCTKIGCVGNIFKRQAADGQNKCKPGTSWKESCNSCQCTETGDSVCTKIECVGYIAKREAPKQDMDCVPGSSWKMSCNSCWCSDNGTPLCTNKGCAVEKREAPKQEMECVPGTSWKMSCNSCWCSDNGTPLCTKKGCVVERLREREEREKRDTSKLESNSILNHVIMKRGVCKPNQEFQIDCNPCKCAASGQSYTCAHSECLEGDSTNKEVEVFMESEGADHIERHSVCKPRDTFYIGCNICHCNQYGTDYSCTNKPCPLPADVEIFHELKVATTKSSNNTKQVVCVANRMFIMNCNTCWCNEDGTSFFCTRRICTPEAPDSTDETNTEDPEIEVKLRLVKKECRPNEIFELDCNMCRCSADGKSFSCTRRACVDVDDKNATLIRKTRAVQEAAKACQPGSEFRMDCNKCLCNDEGQDFSCTRIDCAAQNGNGGADGARSKRELSETVSMQCVAGSVFDRECNVCRCTADGMHSVCTIKRCKQPVEPETTESAPAFRCTPGDQFKQDCKDCTCSADGKNVFCTLRICDQVLGDIKVDQ